MSMGHLAARDSVGDAIDAITYGVAQLAAGTAKSLSHMTSTSTVVALKATSTLIAPQFTIASPAAPSVPVPSDPFAVVASISSALGATATAAADPAKMELMAAQAAAAVQAIPSTLHDYTWAYIYANQTNPWDPTYRYPYIFWIVMGVILTTYAVAHHLRLSGGIVGAYFNRWGMKRHTVRYGPKKSGRSFILPSNSYLLTMGIVMFTILMLTLVGYDKISEGVGVFSSFDKHKRAYDEMMADIYKVQVIRPKHHDTVNKSLWSAGNRFGMMAFAVMPLIVLMALKSGPFGVLTSRYFTALHWDKVGTFHRAGGWFVWWLVTIHVILWTNQLFKDHYDGRPMWFCMLIATRFRSAIFAYFCMTAAMVTSIRWIRNRVYEIFYLSHVVFILLCFIFAIVHHHVIGYWIGACLVLWAGDRFTRWTRGGYINGVFGTAKETKSNNPFHDKYEAEADAPLVEIPAGYAQAQILPSKTVRLSIRTHRPMKWAPGQSLLLTLPELSKLQTHPFSISNNDPNEIVLLIKARKGLTLDLYNLVLERTRQTLKTDKRRSMLPQAAPIHVKARVDGPMGSAGRVPWTEFSNVLIVCGGSGVTFGLAVCDYLASIMTKPDYAGATRRVRFVWIVREYAEITWAASALCRFRAALNFLQLEINIYVTNGEKSTRVNRQRKSNPEEDVSDDESITQGARPGFSDSAPGEAQYDPETGLTFDESDIRGLTNYEGEEDNDDSKDRRLSRIFQEEGKLRRMRSRQSAILQRQHSNLTSEHSHYSHHAELQREVSRASAARSSMLRPYSVHSSIGHELTVPGVGDVPALPPGAAKRVSDIRMADRSGSTLSPHQQALARLQAAPAANGGLSPIAASPDSDDGSRVPSPVGLEVPAPLTRTVSPLARTPLSRQDTETTLGNEAANPYNPYGADPLSPTDSLDSIHYKAFTSRTQDMVLLEDTPDAKKGAKTCMSCGHCEGDSLWIDDGDYTATKIMSEYSRTGRPPLQSILKEEMANAEGQTIIATCGPVGLNTTLRNLVSSNIDTAKIRAGDPSGYVTMYSEDFEM